MRKWSPVILITVSLDRVLSSGKVDQYCRKIQKRLNTHLEYLKSNSWNQTKGVYSSPLQLALSRLWPFFQTAFTSLKIFFCVALMPWCLSPVLKHFFCVPSTHFSCVALMSWRWSIYSGKKIAFIGLGGVIGAARWYWGTGRLSLSMIINRTQSISPIIVAICLKFFFIFLSEFQTNRA